MAVTEKLPAASTRSSTRGLLGRLRLGVEETSLFFSMSHLVCVSSLIASYITTPGYSPAASRNPSGCGQEALWTHRRRAIGLVRDLARALAHKADLTAGQGRHQVLDRGIRGNDAFAMGLDALVVSRKLPVHPSLQLVDLGGECAVRGKDAPEPNERPHHQDAHFHGPRRVQHRGGHERAMLGEGGRKFPLPSPLQT